MSDITKVLIVLFFAYVFQSIFSYFQLKNMYDVVNQVRRDHKGENVTLVTGTGRTAWFLIARGYFTILVVDPEDVVVDYWGMSGVTNFSRPRQRPEFIGLTLDEVEAKFTKKNEKKAFTNAREQLEMLRKYATEKEAQDTEEKETQEVAKGGDGLVS